MSFNLNVLGFILILISFFSCTQKPNSDVKNLENLATGSNDFDYTCTSDKTDKKISNYSPDIQKRIVLNDASSCAEVKNKDNATCDEVAKILGRLPDAIIHNFFTRLEGNFKVSDDVSILTAPLSDPKNPILYASKVDREKVTAGWVLDDNSRLVVLVKSGKVLTDGVRAMASFYSQGLSRLKSQGDDKFVMDAGAPENEDLLKSKAELAKSFLEDLSFIKPSPLTNLSPLLSGEEISTIASKGIGAFALNEKDSRHVKLINTIFTHAIDSFTCSDSSKQNAFAKYKTSGPKINKAWNDLISVVNSMNSQAPQSKAAGASTQLVGDAKTQINQNELALDAGGFLALLKQLLTGSGTGGSTAGTSSANSTGVFGKLSSYGQSEQGNGGNLQSKLNSSLGGCSSGSCSNNSTASASGSSGGGGCTTGSSCGSGSSCSGAVGSCSG